MTRRRLEFHPLAEFELTEAHEWYDQWGADLADRFELAFNVGVQKIIEGPERWPLCFGPTRRFILKKFPYCIVYHATPSVIRVLALAHTSREPDYWQDRIWS